MRFKLRFENVLKHRYYLVYLTQDLFGEWVIIKSWGGIDKAGGQVISIPCTTYEEAIIQIERIKKIRERRGYALVHSSVPPKATFTFDCGLRSR